MSRLNLNTTVSIRLIDLGAFVAGDLAMVVCPNSVIADQHVVRSGIESERVIDCWHE